MGGYPIAITADPEPVRLALEAGLRELWAFAGDVAEDAVLRRKAKGNIGVIEDALRDLSEPQRSPVGDSCRRRSGAKARTPGRPVGLQFAEGDRTGRC